MFPTEHQLRAAVRVALAVDAAGSALEDARTTYTLVLSQGEHRADDLEIGERILEDVGLLRLTADGRILPSPALAVIASLTIDDAVSCLRRLLAQQDSAASNIERGIRGEEVVAAACREELSRFSRDDLAVRVQRVSLLDDTLGYDVVAPSIVGADRLLEVKTSSDGNVALFQFYLTRNEFEVGRRESEWALVAVADPGQGVSPSIVGWCRASTLHPYLPNDRNGRWTEALVRIPRSGLIGGHPPAV